MTKAATSPDLEKLALIPRILFYSPIVDKAGVTSSEIAVGQEIKPGLRKPKGSDRVPTADIDEANLVSSYVAMAFGSLERMNPDLHAPVLDIDNGEPQELVADISEWWSTNLGHHLEPNDFCVIPSTTPGHFHLYVEEIIDWMSYLGLMDYLEDLGWLESGYVAANVERGATFVRKPGHLKPPPFTLDGLSV